MKLNELKMDSKLIEEVNTILDKDIDPIYHELSKRIAPEIENSEYIPWLFAHKMPPEGVKVLLALPDQNWKLGMGEYEVSDEFIASLGIDAGFVRKQLEESYYSGDLKFDEKTGPDLVEGFGWWADCQFGPEWMERNGRAYYKILAIIANQEHSIVVENRTDARIKEGKKSNVRIIPRYDSVKDIPELLPVENFKEILKSKGELIQKLCNCRYLFSDDHEGTYEYNNLCLCANEIGKDLGKLGMGDFDLWEDTFECVNRAGKKEPMCSVTNNCMNLEEIHDMLCNCNVDTCIMFRQMEFRGGRYKATDICNKSRFRAVVDITKCENCGLCKDRCMFDAIHVRYYRDQKAQGVYVNEDQCMGCGCCVETCPTGALTMKLVDPPEALMGYSKDLDGNYIVPKEIDGEK